MNAIVVAIDFAEMTDFVLAEAIREASHRKAAELHAVCAIDPSLDVGALDLGLDFAGELGKLEEALEARVAGPLKDAGLTYEVHAMLGAPASAIADLARRVDAGLVIVGRHSRPGQATLGSVPAKVLALTRCSVLVVQPTDNQK